MFRSQQWWNNQACPRFLARENWLRSKLAKRTHLVGPIASGPSRGVFQFAKLADEGEVARSNVALNEFV